MWKFWENFLLLLSYAVIWEDVLKRIRPAHYVIITSNNRISQSQSAMKQPIAFPPLRIVLRFLTQAIATGKESITG